jgi:hypothetical protein
MDGAGRLTRLKKEPILARFHVHNLHDFFRAAPAA